MAVEIRNGDSKVRVVRLLGHRDDASAWQIRDFLTRSVVEFQWIERSTEEDCCRELGLSDPKNVNLPVVELPNGTRLFGPTLRDVAERLGGFVTVTGPDPPDQRQGASLLACGARALLSGDGGPGLIRRRRCAPPQRVRARWPSPLFTDTWRKRHDPRTSNRVSGGLGCPGESDVGRRTA